MTGRFWHCMLCFKFGILRCALYILATLLIFVLVVTSAWICFALANPSNFDIDRALLALVGALLSTAFFLVKRHESHTKITMELMDRFNREYQECFSSERITMNNLKKYLDLCAEEYFFYYQGFVSPVAWSTWAHGMHDTLIRNNIHEKAKQELDKGGYYGLTWEEIEKHKNSAG